MTKFIALLRGINVGGKRKILMADLRKILNEYGFENVQTYIQSGNVVFDYADDCENCSTRISVVIKQKYGFEVPVIIRSAAEWGRIAANNPLLVNRAIASEQLYVTFLSHKPKESDINIAKQPNYAPDYFEVLEKNIYGYCEDKYHLSKYTNGFFEKKLHVKASTRNWKTVLKILELVK